MLLLIITMTCQNSLLGFLSYCARRMKTNERVNIDRLNKQTQAGSHRELCLTEGLGRPWHRGCEANPESQCPQKGRER